MSWDDVEAVVGRDIASRLRAVAVRGGRLLVDVPVCAGDGPWPEGTNDHRAHAIWLPAAPPAEPRLARDVDVGDRTRDEPVTIVVADGGATRPQVGQVLAHSDMFSRSYPDHGLLQQLVVVDEPQEPNIAWTYATLGIEVVIADA